MSDVYRIRPGARFYGASVGILLFDEDQPLIPGSMGNASTFKYPVQYQVIQGLRPASIFGDPDRRVIDEACKAARALERNGSRFITGGCGFFIKLQADVARAVTVPVALSSLLQIPMIINALPSDQCLGIVTAVAGQIDTALLQKAGMSAPDRVRVEAIDQDSLFHRCINDPSQDFDAAAMQVEVVATSRRLVAGNNHVGAILLECSEFPPYSAAVQAATQLPVFDFVSLVNYFTGALRPSAYDGWY